MYQKSTIYAKEKMGHVAPSMPLPHNSRHAKAPLPPFWADQSSEACSSLSSYDAPSSSCGRARRQWVKSS